jgi:Uma2 family endonuclease
MTAARKLGSMTVEEYLAGELSSPVKHEYLDGYAHAMAGATNVHNLIATNITGALHARLRGKPCRVYNSDTKARVRLSHQTRFYYPDAMIVCRPTDPGASYQDEPVVAVEVISPATRRTDEGEKKDAYLSLSSVSVYLLVEQDSEFVTAFRRTDGGFVREIHEGSSAVIPLPEIEAILPLAEIYEAVELSPETRDVDIE